MSVFRRKPGSGAMLALLILLALVIRVAAAVSRPMIEMDETSYVRMAENLSAGLGPLDITGLDATNFSPLLSLMTAGMAFVTRDYVVAAYVISTVFGALLLVPVYLLAKELAGKRAGLMAAALAAAFPVFVDYSSRIYNESVFVFFLLLSIVFARHMLRGCRIPCSTLAGAALGLAYLANPSALAWLALFLALALIVALKRGIVPQMARAGLVMVLFFSIYAAPYIIFLHSELGTWTYQGKAAGNSYAAARGLRHNTVEWEREMLALTDSGETIRLYRLNDSADPAGNVLKDPKTSLRNLARQADYFYTREAGRVMPLWLLPLMGLGLFATGWTRSRAAGVGYLLVMMLPAIPIFTVYNVYTRLFIPFMALTLVWIAQGWERLEGWAGETLVFSFGEEVRQRRQVLAGWLVGAVVLVPLLAVSAGTMADLDYQSGYREAGESLKSAAGLDTRILSRETSAAFYAGGTLVWLPYTGYDEVTRYARRQGVDYLVISRRDIEERRPDLARLTGTGQDHPEWREVGGPFTSDSDRTYIFELVS